MKHVVKLLCLLLCLSIFFCFGVSAEENDKIVIGASFHSTYHEFFVTMIEGMKEAAEINNVELLIQDDNMDIASQDATIATFINSGVDAIILLAIDTEALNAAAKEAVEAGIPVITIDTKITDPDAYTTFIGSDSEQMGKQAGAYALEYIKENMSGTVKAAGLGWLSHPVSVLRVTGFRDAISDAENVVWVGEQEADSRDVALSVAENMLQANPDLNLLYGGNEGTLLGSLAAVESQDMLDQVTLCGIDTSEEILDAIDDGRIAFTVAQQPFEMGVVSIESCLAALKGEKLEKNQVIDCSIVTKENTADYR